MNRWAARIIGLLLLLVFSLTMLQMYKTLVKIKQQQEQSAPASR